MSTVIDDAPKSLDELIALDDSSFLAAAYRQLLGRPIDPAGFRDYDSRLRRGTSRLEIVAELRSSAEGLAHRSALPGLAAALAQHKVHAPPAAINSLRELFRLEEEAYVDALIATLLRRPASADERMRQAERVRAGVPKMVLLAEVAARAEGAELDGLHGYAVAARAIDAGLCPVALDVDDLLSFDDHAFVDCAYKTLIGRRADPAGLTHYVSLLRSGAAKIGVALRLARSAEGRRRGARLGGLNRAARLYLLGRVPVFGRVICALTGCEGETTSERRQRALENRLQRLLQDSARARVDADTAVAAVDRLLCGTPEGSSAQ